MSNQERGSQIPPRAAPVPTRWRGWRPNHRQLTRALAAKETELTISKAEVERLKEENGMLFTTVQRAYLDQEEVKRIQEESQALHTTVVDLSAQVELLNKENLEIQATLSEERTDSLERENVLNAMLDSQAAELRELSDRMQRLHSEAVPIDEHNAATRRGKLTRYSSVMAPGLIWRIKAISEAHHLLREHCMIIEAKDKVIEQLKRDERKLDEQYQSLLEGLTLRHPEASDHNAEITTSLEKLVNDVRTACENTEAMTGGYKGLLLKLDEQRREAENASEIQAAHFTERLNKSRKDIDVLREMVRQMFSDCQDLATTWFHKGLLSSTGL
ncbi:hypothetical protein V5O48_016249 [Marasmius crinis-equi]|uniref:Uncharacterized protein n=1 Tax=Marasmius crinis-equi TaxID=585013 RepID=A0ABR3ES77_9AGAR